MRRLEVSGRPSKASSVSTTMSPFDSSYPLAMSEYGTSSPHFVQTRRNLIRPPSSRWTWWNATSRCSVAEYSFTGIVTSPKEIAPFQMLRMKSLYPLYRGLPALSSEMSHCGLYDDGPDGSRTRQRQV